MESMANISNYFTTFYRTPANPCNSTAVTSFVQVYTTLAEKFLFRCRGSNVL